MRTTTNLTEKEQIYRNGSNAVPMSLASVSLNASSLYAESFIYNLYDAAFADLGADLEGDEQDNFDRHSAREYANTMVEDLFLLNRTRIEGDGALVLNVAMAYWGHLSRLLRACEIKADASVMIAELDKAAAFWVGAGQDRTSNTQGWMLYNLAERASSLFEQDEASGEAKVNVKVLETLIALKSDINEGVCAVESGYLQMRQKVRTLISRTNVVLVQMLLHHVVVSNDSDYIELYALALLPQISSCNRGAYETLLLNAIEDDVSADTKPSVITAVQSAYSCLGITCEDVGAYAGSRIVQCQDPRGPAQLGSYTPTTDVRRLSYIDRDVRAMAMMMRLEAKEAAYDVYRYGWYTYFSLRQLATNGMALPSTNVVFEQFKSYYDDDNFAENMIVNVLEKQEPFGTGSTRDRTEVVVGVLQGVVMYASVIARLEAAVPACQSPNQTTESALQYWDGGAAFFIGSMESADGSGEPGQFIYGLANILCSDFMTCESEMHAAVNSGIVNFLEYGRNTLSDGLCQQVETIIQNDIKPYLLIPLIQATLRSAGALEEGVDGAAGALHAYSRAVLPAVNAANPSSASTLNTNANFLPDRKPDIEAVFDAFRSSLPTMETECRRIGEMTTKNVRRGVCEGDVPIGSPSDQSEPVVSPPPTRSPIYVAPSSPDDLAWGRYAFVDSSVADNDAKFSLDVRDIYRSSDVTAAEAIYSESSKNAPNGLSGDMAIFSLSDMSTKAITFMRDDPLFNLYRYAFYDDSDFDDIATDRPFSYADTVVRLALNPSKGNSPELASDAAVVMNVFLLIAHRLNEACRRCEQQGNTAFLIDSAVGLWIGREQAQAGFDSGWMLYAQAQRALKMYGQAEGEAPVNTELMVHFNDAQATALQCPNDPTAFRKLQQITDSIVRALTRVLMQRLLVHVSEDNKNYVELYSLGFVPQAIGCNKGSFEKLRDILFLDFDRSSALDNGLISHLAKVAHCLRYTCKDLGDTSSGSPELKSLIGGVCMELAVLSTSTTLAGYQTDFDVSELARLDLDIRQIEIFMRTRSYNLARDYYENGRNSLDAGGNVISLYSLATDVSLIHAADTYQLFQDYFQSEYYADNLVRSVLQSQVNGTSAFANASRLQLSEAVVRTLQTMVTYMQIVSKLRSAVEDCSKSQGGGQELIDEAAALFVGSIEGPSSGGDSGQSGKFLFALSKETCGAFDKCDDHEDATVNEFVLVSLRDIKRSIGANDCNSVGTMVEDVLSIMPVPLVQGTLSLAVNNEDLPARSEDPALATGYVLASAILPLVKAANATSAATIEANMDFNLDAKPVLEGVSSLFEAFHGALSSMDINCHYIGSLQPEGLSVCDDSQVGPASGTATNLGDDLYVSTTYVQDRANIALDVKAMQDALMVGREALARIIYKEGENSPIYDENKVKVDLRTLSRFSTDANATMKDNPLYQMAVYALRDSQGLYLGRDAWEYADTIVQEAMSKGAPVNSPIAAEAAVALNLWMEMANELYQTLSKCKSRELVDDDGIHSIDEAAAYWIGDGQVKGDAEKGHLFYALAEQMGDVFGINENGQSKTNVNILRLFHQARIELSLSNACSEGDSTYRRLRHIINRITTEMVIVNVQGLIHNLLVGDQDRVRIYAHAFVPLTVTCGPSNFAYLREKLIDFEYTEIEVDSILESIQSTYSCFDIMCTDIGIHQSRASTCVDASPTQPLAGYTPSTDVRNFAKLDLDISEIDVLMQMEAYGPAEDLYAYGKHSTMGSDDDRTGLSLQYLATSPGRSAVPQFETFKQFYGGDDRYADTIIRYALLSNNGMLSEQRRLVVTAASQYIVLYMAALQSMYEAVSSCEKGMQNAAQDWDTAAGWLIGHLEGSSKAGSGEGLLLWGLAKEQCEEFETCSVTVQDSAEINDKLVLRLFTGRGAVLAKSCGELRQTADEVSGLLPVPLIQAALSTAVQLRSSRGDRRARLLALGYVYSQALLPIIYDINDEAAATIASSFDLAAGKVIPEGVPALVSAYSTVLSGLGVKCEDVGSSETIDVCTGSVKSNAGLIIGLITIFVAVGVAIFIWRMKRARRRKEEEQPIFKKSIGELNHITSFGIDPPEDGESKTSSGEEDDLLEHDVHDDGSIASDDYDDSDVQEIQVV